MAQGLHVVVVVVFVKMADVNEKGELAVWVPLVWDSMILW